MDKSTVAHDTHGAPRVQPPPAWAVMVTPTDLRLLQACVEWLAHVQSDRRIQERLVQLRARLDQAQPIVTGR